MKRVVTVAIAASGLLALAILLRKPPADPPRPPAKAPDAAPREASAAPAADPGIAPPPPSPAEKAAPADPRRLLADLAKALRDGDEKTVRAIQKTLHELLSPPVPEDQNAAVLYLQAFEVAKKTPGLIAMKGLDLKVYGEALSSRELGPEQKAALRAWFETNGAAAAEVTDLLREGARRAGCRFPTSPSALPGTLGYAGNLLRITAMVQEDAGKSDQAADTALAGLSLASAIRTAPDLTSQLLGCTQEAITLEAFQVSLSPASAKVAARLDALDPASVRDSFLRALLGDVDVTIESVLKSKADPASVTDEALRRKIESPLLFQDLAAYVDGIDAFARLAGRPYYETRDELAAMSLQHGELAPWYASYSQNILPRMPGLSRVIATSEARISMAKLSLELERYRTKNGGYPATLGALGSEQARDPFSGQPFTYRREGAGFVIESAGDGKKPLNWTRR